MSIVSLGLIQFHIVGGYFISVAGNLGYGSFQVQYLWEKSQTVNRKSGMIIHSNTAARHTLGRRTARGVKF